MRSYGMTVPEMFQNTVVNKTGFGLDEYKIPRTLNYIEKSHKFPKAHRSDIQREARKRSKDPDPAKYEPSVEATLKRCWTNSSGKFHKGNRKTLIDEVMKTGKLSPGPGQYLTKPVNKSPPLGKFR